MNYSIISTGSKGNAVVIEDIVLIDCGVSFKALHDVYKNLKCVLLTHIHSDHFNKRTIKRLANERPTIRFICADFLYTVLLECNVCNIDVLDVGKMYDYMWFKVSPIKLYHNVPNIGYRLFINGEKLIYATDTNTLEGITAKDYNLYLIECNYVDDEIQKRIEEKEANGIYPYEKDVLQNHLSKQKCDDFIIQNIGDRGEYVYMHKHED